MAQLAPIVEALASELRMSRLKPRVTTESRVRLTADELLVPARFEAHWRRFGTLATDLVRDAAYAAARPRMGEGEAILFSETFVREHVLSHD